MPSKKRVIEAPVDTAANFDWNLIRSFLAVMEAGSLLGAAKVIESTQPTVGRHIEALEKQWGKVLFERTGRGLKPTEAATTIATHARRMRDDADALGRAVTNTKRVKKGLVRIASSRLTATYGLPELVLQLQRDIPAIDIAVVASDETSNLLQREADIAIRHVRPTQSSLIAKKLGDTPIKACASVEYLARFGTPGSIEDLSRHRVIGPDRDSAAKEQMMQIAKATGFEAESMHFPFRSDDVATCFAAVCAGNGIGFFTQQTIRQVDTLKEIEMGIPLPVLPVWLVVHRELKTTPRIRVVYDTLADRIREWLA